MRGPGERRRTVGAASLVCFVAALTMAVAAARQGQAPSLPDIPTLGPQVGARVPDFTLVDQHGHTRSLASLMGPKGLMLVFNRSADW
jgi:hypothetical protein